MDEVALSEPVSTGDLDVSVILVNYNTESLLQRCLDRLALAVVTLPHPVFSVDNALRDGSLRVRCPDSHRQPGARFLSA